MDEIMKELEMRLLDVIGMGEEGNVVDVTARWYEAVKTRVGADISLGDEDLSEEQEEMVMTEVNLGIALVMNYEVPSRFLRGVMIAVDTKAEYAGEYEEDLGVVQDILAGEYNDLPLEAGDILGLEDGAMYALGKMKEEA